MLNVILTIIILVYLLLLVDFARQVKEFGNVVKDLAKEVNGIKARITYWTKGH